MVHRSDRTAPRRAPRAMVPLLLASLASGCAVFAPPPPSGPGAEDVVRLEGEVSRDPADFSRLVELGTAYRAADRLADARAALERALALEPGEPAAVLMLGLTYEDLELFREARDLYATYVETGSSRALKARLRGRMALLERKALRNDIRAAVAGEAALAASPDARFVAIFPFVYGGSNPDYQPLGRALAELLTTDLAQTDRITVLERVKAQILLDELKLAEGAAVDPSTAARGGRLLGAGRVVQGRISDGPEQIRLDAMIVDVAGGVADRALSDQDLVRGLFDLEKRIALAIYDALGVQLTAAERERVNRRPTESLQALLEYGLGLQAEDADDYTEAARHFERASEIDAGFEPARARSEAVLEVAVSEPVTTEELGALVVAEVPPPLPSVEAIQVMVPVVGGRDAGAEVLGNEGVGRPLILEIILRRPQ